MREWNLKGTPIYGMDTENKREQPNAQGFNRTTRKRALTKTKRQDKWRN